MGVLSSIREAILPRAWKCLTGHNCYKCFDRCCWGTVDTAFVAGLRLYAHKQDQAPRRIRCCAGPSVLTRLLWETPEATTAAIAEGQLTDGSTDTTVRGCRTAPASPTEFGVKPRMSNDPNPGSSPVGLPQICVRRVTATSARTARGPSAGRADNRRSPASDRRPGPPCCPPALRG
jgi:hypothetical protein